MGRRTGWGGLRRAPREFADMAGKRSAGTMGKQVLDEPLWLAGMSVQALLGILARRPKQFIIIEQGASLADEEEQLTTNGTAPWRHGPQWDSSLVAEPSLQLERQPAQGHQQCPEVDRSQASSQREASVPAELAGPLTIDEEDGLGDRRATRPPDVQQTSTTTSGKP